MLSEKKQIPIKSASDIKYKDLIKQFDGLNKKISDVEKDFKKRNLKEERWGRIIAKSNENKINIGQRGNI